MQVKLSLPRELDEKAKMESKLSSAVAFVEGDVQDACSICLDAFCDSNPSVVRTSAAAAKYFGCF
jgi:hypothetical protein|uniref:Uncharacterized protein n=1 Tax=Zea mays TaxID=4577 RepID=A0A804Q374_MAIZE